MRTYEFDENAFNIEVIANDKIIAGSSIPMKFKKPATIGISAETTYPKATFQYIKKKSAAFNYND